MHWVLRSVICRALAADARHIFSALSVGGSLLLTSTALATEKEAIRHDLLSSELGALLPTGAGVRVGQVEAPVSGNYMPSPNPPTFAEFSGKSFAAQSGASGVSNHARGVGQWFYGNDTSIAPGINEIEGYEVNDFLTTYLGTGTTALPTAPTARVFNHSWVGQANTQAFDREILRRVDYLIDTYDVIHVVGSNNGFGSQSLPLLSHGMNTITVGRTDGNHSVGTTDLNDPAGQYVAGRNAPDLVAPRTTTSHATALVSGAVAMLIEAADANPGWSNGSYQVPNGVTIQHAASSEVIKAALMAGARREDVGSYVVNTQNGLNLQYGAGELDIYNSYHILAGGEQNGGSPLDAPVYVDAYGFDYSSSFGNSDVAWYHFDSATELSVTLAWNIDIAGGTTVFDPTGSLANFDLYLYQVEESGATLVAQSTSTIDNTENLWLDNLDPMATYRIAVVRDDALGAFDYGLAWRITIVPEPSSLVLAAMGSAAGVLMVMRRKSRRSRA